VVSEGSSEVMRLPHDGDFSRGRGGTGSPLVESIGDLAGGGDARPREAPRSDLRREWSLFDKVAAGFVSMSDGMEEEEEEERKEESDREEGIMEDRDDLLEVMLNDNKTTSCLSVESSQVKLNQARIQAGRSMIPENHRYQTPRKAMQEQVQCNSVRCK
jgi:hypothetical protein